MPASAGRAGEELAGHQLPARASHWRQRHRGMELFGLEKPSQTIQPNHCTNPTMTTKPCPRVPWAHGSEHLQAWGLQQLPPAPAGMTLWGRAGAACSQLPTASHSLLPARAAPSPGAPARAPLGPSAGAESLLCPPCPCSPCPGPLLPTAETFGQLRLSQPQRCRWGCFTQSLLLYK